MMSMSKSIDLYKLIDRKSFMLGMMTAFAECLAGECKKCAFSPPFKPTDLYAMEEEAHILAQEQGLHLWLEKNEDIQEESRVYWYVMYKFPEVLEEYHEIRKTGKNPAKDFDAFRLLLSYGTIWGDHAEKVVPKMRQSEAIMGTVSRILFSDGGWPIEKDKFS
ncbi:MAG: hypothetical protein WCY81_03135 [Sphaerochaetaceae bacterium]|jgi:hypothetical protein